MNNINKVVNKITVYLFDDFSRCKNNKLIDWLFGPNWSELRSAVRGCSREGRGDGRGAIPPVCTLARRGFRFAILLFRATTCFDDDDHLRNTPPPISGKTEWCIGCPQGWWATTTRFPPAL